MSESKLNPLAQKAMIGIKELREITIYPLSIMEQKELSEVLFESLTVASQLDEEITVGTVYSFVDIISSNIIKVIDCVTDEKGEEIAKDITNEQAVEISEIVYEMNYGGNARKKFINLVNKIKNKS